METKCFGDNYKTLVWDKAILVINIHFFTHQSREQTLKNVTKIDSVINIYISSQTLCRQNHDVTNMTVTDLFQLSKFIFCKKSSKS